MHAGCQEQDGPYKGLKDADMIRILKNFTHQANRWNVPPEDGRLLYDLILRNHYKQVMEVGTSNGYSALWMGFALQKTGGRLITIEINRQRALEARQNMEEAGLSSVVEVRLNDALDELPKLEGLVDMVFLQALRNRSLYETQIHRDSRQGLLVAYKRDNAEGR